jgi:hypothetical protein
MENTPGKAAVEPEITTSTNGRKRGKLRLLSRDKLDRRTLAAKKFDAIATGIAADLGGKDRLTTVQRHLVEAFAGAAVHMHDLNARLLLGQQVDIISHSQVISTMVRIASRIGVHRVARDVTPDLQTYLTHHAAGPETKP